MKWIPNKAFPHPVLSAHQDPADRDYVNCEFQATHGLEICPKSQKGILECNVALSESSLCALIQEGKAMYATEIHCAKTYFRHLQKSSVPSYEIRFESGDLHSAVEVSSYVICTHPVRGHASGSLHAEFGDAKFDLNPGDVLAVSEPEKYYVDPNALESLGTIFQLSRRENPNSEKLFEVGWDNSKIDIFMNVEEADKFDIRQHSHETWPSLLSSVYLVALMETLRVMEKEEDEHADKQWFEVIQQTIANKGFSIDDDALKLAQRLLDNPILDLLGTRGE